jgi:two-component system, OmpR family, sensor kinase
MKPLRTQLLLLLSGVVLLYALVQSAVMFFSARHEAGEILDYHQRSIAQTLRHGDFESVASDLRAQDGGTEEFAFAIQVVAADGTLRYRSDPGVDLPLRTRPGFMFVTLHDGPWRVYTLAGAEQTVQVAQSVEVRRVFALEFVLDSLAPMLVLVPLLLLAVAYVVNRALRPLRGVVAQIENRAADHLEPLDPAGVLPELRPVVRSMNRLFERIRAAFEIQRSFVANAAHELRSPLAALKLQAQLLGRAGDEATRRLALQRLQAGVDRSTHLTEQLLSLAREEEAPAEGDGPASGSLRSAAELALSDVALLAADRGTDVGLVDANDAEVGVPTESLRVLVRNLVDNAVRHAPAEGRVDVRISGSGGSAVLEVADSGPGIPQADHQRVFDRFYRRAGAAPGGSGLGLAIVQAIVLRHGAQMSLDRSVLGGLRVKVTFRGANGMLR